MEFGQMVFEKIEVVRESQRHHKHEPMVTLPHDLACRKWENEN
jgi:hypothetical protein